MPNRCPSAARRIPSPRRARRPARAWCGPADACDCAVGFSRTIPWRGVLERKIESERRSLSGCRHELDVAAQQAPHAAGERESEPGSAVAPRCRPVDLTELVEYENLCRRLDTDAGILYAVDDPAVGYVYRGTNLTLRGELE